MRSDRQPWDGPLSAIRNRVEDVATWLAIWERRREPDARARRHANDAVDAIDAMLGDLHAVRQQLISEIRDSDDASAARADEPPPTMQSFSGPLLGVECLWCHAGDRLIWTDINSVVVIPV